MHPDIALKLMNQHSREMITEARDASLARKMRAALRARRHAPEGFVPPAIPDTVAELMGESARDVQGQRPATTR
ncbi:MAG: hypothetical protein ABSA93_21465 [Streptosporangiaceae bacterium]|jgi:hypothetical protein